MFPFNIRQSKDVIYRELVAFLDGMIYFVDFEVKMINTPENCSRQRSTLPRNSATVGLKRLDVSAEPEMLRR